MKLNIEVLSRIKGITISPKTRQKLIDLLKSEHKHYCGSEPQEITIIQRNYPCVKGGCYEKIIAVFFKLFNAWAVVIYKKYGNYYSAKEYGDIKDFKEIIIVRDYAFKNTVNQIIQYLKINFFN